MEHASESLVEGEQSRKVNAMGVPLCAFCGSGETLQEYLEQADGVQMTPNARSKMEWKPTPPKQGEIGELLPAVYGYDKAPPLFSLKDLLSCFQKEEPPPASPVVRKVPKEKWLKLEEKVRIKVSGKEQIGYVHGVDNDSKQYKVRLPNGTPGWFNKDEVKPYFGGRSS
mmetsp:Transcript_153817/g.271455  ORF Transcript_153817/g.271455 Transcript_153817/m.271455 type:complete len:169 (+) Transcript_153817:60-566(+)